MWPFEQSLPLDQSSAVGRTGSGVPWELLRGPRLHPSDPAHAPRGSFRAGPQDGVWVTARRRK